MLRHVVWTLALLLGFFQTVLAQSEPRVLERGAHSIIVGVGTNTSIGYSRRVAERTDIGIEVGVRISDDDDTHSRSISLRPGLKRYLSSAESDLAPYILLGVSALWSRLDSSGALDLSARELGGFVGVGIDWFPVQRVSVGGHLGVESSLTTRDRASFPPTPDDEASGYTVSTYSSGIRVQLYF